jgi:hypothetical protein
MASSLEKLAMQPSYEGNSKSKRILIMSLVVKARRMFQKFTVHQSWREIVYAFTQNSFQVFE